MRKLTILLMAILLPLSPLVLNADERPESIKISLDPKPVKNVRSLQSDFIESCYLYTYAGIQTVVTEDSGTIYVYVSNVTSGEFWSYSFDSSIETQSFVKISGNPGYYEVAYVTETGNMYNGSFLIE